MDQLISHNPDWIYPYAYLIYRAFLMLLIVYIVALAYRKHDK